MYVLYKWSLSFFTLDKLLAIIVITIQNVKHHYLMNLPA